MRTLLLLLLFALPAQAQVYKWVDKTGRVIYSDQPRPEAEKLDVSLEPKRPADSGLRPGELQMLDRAEAREQQRRAARDRDRALEARRREAQKRADSGDWERCESAREGEEKIKRRLRGGYSAAEYHGLHERLAAAERRVERYCR